MVYQNSVNHFGEISLSEADCQLFASHLLRTFSQCTPNGSMIPARKVKNEDNADTGKRTSVVAHHVTEPEQPRISVDSLGRSEHSFGPMIADTQNQKSTGYRLSLDRVQIQLTSHEKRPVSRSNTDYKATRKITACHSETLSAIQTSKERK